MTMDAGRSERSGVSGAAPIAAPPQASTAAHTTSASGPAPGAVLPAVVAQQQHHGNNHGNNNNTSAATNNHELLPQRFDAIAKLLEMHEEHQQQQNAKITALFTSLESLRTQLIERNQVVERQTIRLGGLKSEVAALETSQATYKELLQYRDAQLGQLKEQLAVKDAQTAAAQALATQLRQDVERLTAAAARMQAELDAGHARGKGSGAGPSRIGLKRKLPPPPQHPTPNDDNNQQSDDDTTNEAPAQPPRTRTSNARSISSTPAATPRGGGRGGGRGGASNATPLSKPKGLHRELAGLQSAPGGLAPAPKVPRLALLSTGVRGSRGNGRGGRGRGGGGRGGRGGGRGGGRAHAAVGRALMHVRRGGRGGRGRGGRAPASDGGVPAAQEQQKQKPATPKGGRASNTDASTWWDLAEIAPGNIVCVRCSRPDQYSLRLPGKEERFVWICSVTKIRGNTIYGRWYHNDERDLRVPFRLGPELKVPVRIKGRMDILHIYEEDKNFSLSKTEVEELVGEYKHSLTLVFGDSSSESEGEQSGGE